MNKSPQPAEVPPKPSTGRWAWRKRWILMGTATVVIVIALAVGLGVGLTRRSVTDTNPPSSTLPTSDHNTTATTEIWRPAKGTSWNYLLNSAVNTTTAHGFQVWIIDLFDNDASTIVDLRTKGNNVICYFSAGSYEDWRPDNTSFNEVDLGHDLDGWPGERWVNISSSQLREIMTRRLDLAVEKHCDGVDPDNVDAYDNDNGLQLTEADSIDYMSFLSEEAHQRGLAIGLKDAGAIIPSVINQTEWSVNEQCLQYDECDTYSLFILQEKPVFHVEYPKGQDVSNNEDVSESRKKEICDAPSTEGFSTIMKNIDLDAWTEAC
ncbi:hypothetical protein PV10_09207 [Exophiala mesophila]|uniref:alpha-galactosidase n=1 Tax=Exophiala mesophila TaxID=212818 RepID=A0A0D1ZMR6_EXOME|nr:uncharacterized protein PV10_09207 [Exophiala mesophila]KIV88033.1 hypothetical protein PV10_09207 [Exophiala mesophila]